MLERLNGFLIYVCLFRDALEIERKIKSNSFFNISVFEFEYYSLKTLWACCNAEEQSIMTMQCLFGISARSKSMSRLQATYSI